MFKTASHICILCAKLTQPRLSLSLFWYHQIVLFMWVSLPKLCMYFFSICSSDYIVLIDTNQVYSHVNTVQGFVYREYLFYLISWLWCWCKWGWAGVPNPVPTWPPAQLGGISVGISVTTWGARHHGNTTVAGDSFAGPPPLLTTSSSETSRKYRCSVLAHPLFLPPLLTPLLANPPFLTPLISLSSSNTDTKFQFSQQIANFTPNWNFS